jgi:D-alanyl-D-alanine carboxypeptidase/D-alanyl-D-alanine-endopeptidase (penicillin-binding protein 4)
MKSKSLLALFLLFNFYFLLISCNVSKQISSRANTILLKDSSISQGHIGISIYEPALGKYWYEHDATKYFVPASNTKLFTLYAGMKYLGDSLIGLEWENANGFINVYGTGDPTFLHPDFKEQPALDFLKAQTKKIYLSGPRDSALGKGWAWDDYNDAYMAERSAFPIYGNTVKISIDNYADPQWKIIPKYFNNFIDSPFVFDYYTAANRRYPDTVKLSSQKFFIVRDIASNKLNLKLSKSLFKNTEIPFYTNGVRTAAEILKNDFALNIVNGSIIPDEDLWFGSRIRHKIRSQPSDSVFKPIMHRSDNFFAEQTLLMVSNEQLGYMNDEKIIDTLLKTVLKDVPQKPRWVDGSGLSRYNLFTPQSFVYILNKMKDEFGMERLKNILPTGNEGSLKNYYLQDSGYIFAKTGSLSNNCTLSGYLYTNKGKLLIFSILTNNFQGSATPVRRAVERFLQNIRNRY